MQRHYFNIKDYIHDVITSDEGSYIFEDAGYRLTLKNQSSIGFYRFDRNYPHMHDIYEVCLIIDGEGHYDINGTLYPLRTGCITIADPDSIHELTSYKTHDLHLYFFVLIIEKKGKAQSSKLINDFLNRHSVYEAGCDDLLHYLPLIQRDSIYSNETEDVSHLTENRYALLKMMLFEMLARFTYSNSSKHLSSDNNNPLLMKAEHFIMNRLSMTVTVEDIAAHCNISSRQLRRIIQKELGVSPKEWIMNKKINMARSCFEKGESVSHVAQKCGYDNPDYFSQIFKRHCGITPTYYKKSL